MSDGRATLDLTVVAPAHDERENVGPLVAELLPILGRLGLRYEVIVVDDGSSDGTAEELARMLRDTPGLRVLTLGARHARGAGQSAAFRAGFVASRGELIATIDADLQNDPNDLPPLLAMISREDVDLVQGDRTRARCDGRVRRVSSAVGRITRRMLLGDTVRDTGCSLRVMRREVALALPLHYRGMHRFIPHLAQQLGYRVRETPVGHRPRRAGRSKYGIRNRALPGLIDCFAVRWMRRREERLVARELDLPVVERRAVPRRDELVATGPPS